MERLKAIYQLKNAIKTLTLIEWMLWRAKYAHISSESHSEYATTLSQMSKRAVGRISPEMDKAEQCLYKKTFVWQFVLRYGFNWEVCYMYMALVNILHSFFHLAEH